MAGGGYKAQGRSGKKPGSGKHQNLAAEELISAGPLQVISAEPRAFNIRRGEQARSAESSYGQLAKGDQPVQIKFDIKEELISRSEYRKYPPSLKE